MSMHNEICQNLRIALVGCTLAAAMASGCSQAHRPNDAGADGDADSDVDSRVDAEVTRDADVRGDAEHDADALFGRDTDVPWDGDLWEDFCEGYRRDENILVPWLDEGVPPDQTSICTWEEEPVESNLAARVTLNLYSAFNLAIGLIEIRDELKPFVVGLPTIEVEGSSGPYEPDVAALEISRMEPHSRGFTFDVVWPTLPTPSEWGDEWQYNFIVMRVFFEIRCDDAGEVTREVVSATFLNLCFDFDAWHPIWESSGERCYRCEFPGP